jgi:hypothetical protein
MTPTGTPTVQIGTGRRVNRDQAALLSLIRGRFPDLELACRVCTWHRLTDGRLGLIVDNEVLFAAEGNDLVVSGLGHADCFAISTNGNRRSLASAPRLVTYGNKPPKPGGHH